MIRARLKFGLVAVSLLACPPQLSAEAGDIRLAQANERVPGGVENRPAQPGAIRPMSPDAAPRPLPPPMPSPSIGASKPGAPAPAAKPPAKDQGKATKKKAKPDSETGAPTPRSMKSAPGSGNERRPGGIERAPNQPE